MTRIYLGLGSNIDPEAHLRLGVDELRRRYGRVDLSPIYRNPAVGFEGPDFFNMVAGLESDDAPERINDAIEVIHARAGRTRGQERYSSRPLDIDLLLYGDRIIDMPGLRIPRRDVLEYAFVLRPLVDLDPNLVHPLTGKPIAQHWRAFDHDRHLLAPVHINFGE